MSALATSHGAAAGLRERGLALGDDDDRLFDDLLVEQAEFADELVVNKVDLVTARELAALQALLAKLNPGAEQVLVRDGKVPLGKLLGAGRFDFDRAATSPGWLAELRGQESGEADSMPALRRRDARRPSGLVDVVGSVRVVGAGARR